MQKWLWLALFVGLSIVGLCIFFTTQRKINIDNVKKLAHLHKCRQLKGLNSIIDKCHQYERDEQRTQNGIPIETNIAKNQDDRQEMAYEAELNRKRKDSTVMQIPLSAQICKLEERRKTILEIEQSIRPGDIINHDPIFAKLEMLNRIADWRIAIDIAWLKSLNVGQLSCHQEPINKLVSQLDPIYYLNIDFLPDKKNEINEKTKMVVESSELLEATPCVNDLDCGPHNIGLLPRGLTCNTKVGFCRHPIHPCHFDFDCKLRKCVIGGCLEKMTNCNNISCGSSCKSDRECMTPETICFMAVNGGTCQQNCKEDEVNCSLYNDSFKCHTNGACAPACQSPDDCIKYNLGDVCQIDGTCCIDRVGALGTCTPNLPR